VRISVHCGGAVSVTQPYGVPLNRIEEFIAQKAAWIIGKIETLKHVAGPRRISVREYREKKFQAFALVQSRLAYFNTFYGLTIGRIAIRNQKTRWGSCSKKGSLNFNVRIIGLPPELSDYIIVHELCHLAELNHSRNFWALVAQTLPNHRQLRRSLKREIL